MKPGTFVRQNLVDGVIGLVSGIRTGKGYNTQPYVTDDPREVHGREESFILLVVAGPESVNEVGIGGCHEMELIINLYGYAQTVDSNPLTRVNLLLQDVRNMLAQNIGKLSDDADRGLAFRFGDLETDEGILAQSGQAAFVQSAHFVYSNGSNW